MTTSKNVTFDVALPSTSDIDMLALSFVDSVITSESRSGLMGKVVTSTLAKLETLGFNVETGCVNDEPLPSGKTGLEIVDSFDLLTLAESIVADCTSVRLSIDDEDQLKKAKNAALTQMRVEFTRALPEAVREVYAISFAAPTKTKSQWRLKLALREPQPTESLAVIIEKLIATHGVSDVLSTVMVNPEIMAELDRLNAKDKKAA